MSNKRKYDEISGGGGQSSSDDEDSFVNPYIQMSEKRLSTEETKAGPSSFNCPFCEMKYNNENQLEEHKYHVHPHKRKVNKCRMCNFKSPDYYGIDSIFSIFYIV